MRQSTLLNFIALAGRLLGIGAALPPLRTHLNTETGSMYIMAMAVNPHTQRICVWLTALWNLGFVFLQVMAFSLVILGSSQHTCHSVPDCPAGNFSNIFEGGRLPICEDYKEMKKNSSVILPFLKKPAPQVF